MTNKDMAKFADQINSCVTNGKYKCIHRKYF